MQHFDNIIFDLGGVIINLDIPLTITTFKNLAGNYGNEAFSPNPGHQIFKDYETGAISSSQFRDGMRSVVHPDLKDEEIDNAWNAMLLDMPKSRMELLLQLKQRYNTYLLSNTNEIHYNAFHKILFDTHGETSLDLYFHQVYYSHIIQKRKPDAEAFQLILDEHNLTAENTLFLDDMPANLEGANRLGIQTMLVTPENSVHNIFKNF
jgi:putative hydrolase of the HAD superfamily